MRAIDDLTAEERALLEEQLLARLDKSRSRPNHIGPRDPNLPPPLSFAQQRLWIIDQLDPGLPNYNVGRAFRLRGPLDLAAVHHALSSLVARHEPLRTVIDIRDGEPVQVIRDKVILDLALTDLSNVGEADRETEATALARQEMHQPFDLANDLMLRAHVVRLADDDHFLVVTIHHIATDGWSERIFWREFVALYRGYVQNEPVSLPELPIQYADFATWQRNWLTAERAASQLDYWLRVVGDVDPLELPVDYPRPAAFSWRGDRVRFTISASLTEKLRELAAQQKATLYMVFLAAFELLLYRYSNQAVFGVGTPVAGRNRLELETLVGFFVNTLVLRADFTGDPTFAELLQEVRDSTVSALDHQDLPFERLVQALHPERQMNRQPLFQVMFHYSAQRPPAWSLPAVKVEPIPVETESTKFDLMLSVGEDGGEMRGRIAYSTDLFAASTIERMATHFIQLLETLAADPDRPASEYRLQDADEWHRVLVEWNQTATDYPRDASLAELFERQSRWHPDDPALYAGESVISYGELNRRANQVAHGLKRHGLRPHAIVGIALRRSPEAVVAMLGVLKAGGAYFPLDVYSPRARLAFMVEDAGAQIIITSDDMGDVAPAVAAATVTLDDLIAGATEAESDNPPLAATAEDLAYVMYTSGSTGSPKGVAINQRSVSRLVHGLTYVDLGPDEVLLHLASLAFDASTFEIWGALLHGAPLVVAPDGLPDYAELETLIKRHGVTTVWLTAGLFNSIIDHQPQMLGSVRQVLTGGEVLSVAHIRKAQELLPATRFVNGYGPTENTTFTCCYPIPRPLPEDLKSIPIGRPVPNTRVYVLNSGLEPVPVGLVGELYAAGDGLAREYLHRPELNAERFIDNPFQAGDRLYRTGDLVRWLPDGNIEFVGRGDSQVKLRGFRIELGEIQTHLNSHPAVQRSVVDFAPGPDGENRLIAYLVGQQKEDPEAGELAEFLRERLPAYMVPAIFVAVPDIPLTANGKIDYRRLEPRPTVYETNPDRKSRALTAHEEMVAAVFCEVLGLDRVGLYDDFFTLGGHSLLAAQVTTRLAQQLESGVLLRDLFAEPTVAGLATQLARAPGASGADDERRIEPNVQTVYLQPAAIDRSATPYAPPRSPEEEKLAAIWSRALALDQVGIHDRFFDIGGHSLLAIQLLEQVRHSFGKRLPANVLFRAQTIAKMAVLLEQSQTAGYSDILVPIYPDGDEPPFFCVHGFGGGVLGYADLASALGPGHPFYGLQARGLEDAAATDDSVEAMAAHYIAAVRSVQPNGPYRIGGYCFGGVVAFEMARQLEATGEEVGLVAIIEGYAPRQYQRRLPAFSLRRWRTVWENVPYWINDYWSLGARGLLAQAQQKGRRWTRKARRRLGHEAAFQAQDAVPHDLSSLPEHHRQLMEDHLVALRNYQPEPINSRVTLFAAQGKTISKALFGTGDPEHGWGNLTRGGVAIKLVDGGHRDLHLAPHVKSLASALEASLDETAAPTAAI